MESWHASPLYIISYTGKIPGPSGPTQLLARHHKCPLYVIISSLNRFASGLSEDTVYTA